MKLSLRDIFWLALLVASLTFWWREHRQAAEDIRAWRTRSWFVRKGPPVQSQAEMQRLAAVTKFSAFSDDQLDEHLASLYPLSFQDGIEYEPCLAEMARRGMSTELQRHYAARLARGLETPFPSVYFSNLGVLTALRRAQREPDPLRIDVTIGSPRASSKDIKTPLIHVTHANVDVGKQTIGLALADHFLLRNGRWKVVLTNEAGQPVAASTYQSFMGGGLHQVTNLPHGARTSTSTELDTRCYVAAPRSGNYQLQVLYHNELGIANQQDLTGLIVSKSEPIWVTVNNLDDTEPWWTRGPHPALAILAAGALLTAMAVVRIGPSRKIPRRDLAWAALLATIALTFWLDSLHQSSQLRRLVPDAHARWTIFVANSPSR